MPERRDGLALRCAITEALDPPGAGHVAALERLILELRGARASPAAFTAAAEATGSPPLRTAARVYQAVADIPSPDAPEWETVDAAASVEIGPLYLVGFDDYAPVEWALLRALAARNPIAAGLAYEQGRRVFAARHDRVAAWTADAETTNWHPPRSAELAGSASSSGASSSPDRPQRPKASSGWRRRAPMSATAWRPSGWSRRCGPGRRPIGSRSSRRGSSST